ncbi:hypothetical protein ACSAZL_05265 [Methanosarcina sp. T3]|uniref:hypothetical protein n=1 Tax=Methanosarcina sp. T3 TaxID=3439062 RepID=UPI003F83017B
MNSELEAVVKAENKKRVKWGFIWAFICAVLWGMGYVALTILWRVPPYSDFVIFPKGSAGMTVATISITSAMAIIFALVLSVVWVTNTGKLSDLPRTVLFFKASKWYAFGAVFGGPIAIFGSTIAIGYIGAAFAASSALLCSVVGAIVAKFWYGENISRKAWIGICLIVLGGIFIWNPIQMIAEIANPAAPEGIWIGYFGGLMSAIGWGMEGAIAAHALDITDADTGVVTRYIAESFIWITLIWPASMVIFGVNTMASALVATFSSSSFILWMVIAAMSLGICYVALYKAYPLIGVGRGLSISTLYVIFSIIALYVFLGEPIKWWLILGASIAVIGTFVMYWESSDSFLECTRGCKPVIVEIEGGSG